MDRSAVEAIVRREIEPLKRQLGISHWKVSAHYDLRADDCCTRAQCTTLVDYERVRIDFDPDGMDDEAEVIETLLHELLHVVLSPFDIVVNALRDVLDERTRTILQSIHTHAVEKAVINLERMYLGLTSPPPAPKAPKRSSR
jgi:hypothetical protein